jgi:hypothetical protein
LGPGVRDKREKLGVCHTASHWLAVYVAFAVLMSECDVRTDKGREETMVWQMNNEDATHAQSALKYQQTRGKSPNAAPMRQTVQNLAKQGYIRTQYLYRQLRNSPCQYIYARDSRLNITTMGVLLPHTQNV